MTEAVLQPFPSRFQRLVFEGPLTIYDAGTLKVQLQAMLEKTEGDGLELDLAQVTEIDTAGLQLLLLAQRESQRLQRPLRIVASVSVREIIGFYHLDDFFSEALMPGAQA